MTHVVNLLALARPASPPAPALRPVVNHRHCAAGRDGPAGEPNGASAARLATLHTTADAQLLASLKQREQAMREAWQQHQRQRQQYQRRSAIAAWQPRLQALAADLPAQAWLTRLEYQGYSSRWTAWPLTAGANQRGTALTRVAGIRAGKAGGIQRDAEGRWQFSFTLTGARADAD